MHGSQTAALMSYTCFPDLFFVAVAVACHMYSWKSFNKLLS